MSAGGDQGILIGLIILLTAILRGYQDRAPFMMILFFVLTAEPSACFGFMIGIWAGISSS